MATKKIHPGDTMTAEERLDAVIALREPDRVPISMMLYNYAPFHAGVKASDFVSNPDVYMRVMRRVYRDIGPWDIYYNINPINQLIYSYVLMMRLLYPGRELPDDVMTQIEEFEYMTPEDYDKILEWSFYTADYRFREMMMPRFCADVENYGSLKFWAKIAMGLIRQGIFYYRDWKWWKEQGLVVQMGYQAELPFDVFSMARTVVPFSKDLFARPDKIRRAVLKLAPSFAESCILISRIVRVPRVQCYLHRTSNNFISPKHFEELAFPGIEQIVWRLVEAGITPILHCDGDWLRNFKILRRLPEKKMIIQLDGLTDIFKAKEEIGDHTCLFGDVPAEKLVEGDPREVEEYCHKLIEEVGGGGGFVLAAGCEIPYNAKTENLKAMTEAVVKYGYY